MNEKEREHQYKETIRVLANFLDNKDFTPDGKLFSRKVRVARSEDLVVNVYPHDHDPPHFHVISKQRGISALFSIPDVELLEVRAGRLTSSDRKKIQYLFRQSPLQKVLMEKYQDMNA